MEILKEFVKLDLYAKSNTGPIRGGFVLTVFFFGLFFLLYTRHAMGANFVWVGGQLPLMTIS